VSIQIHWYGYKNIIFEIYFKIYFNKNNICTDENPLQRLVGWDLTEFSAQIMPFHDSPFSVLSPMVMQEKGNPACKRNPAPVIPTGSPSVT